MKNRIKEATVDRDNGIRAMWESGKTLQEIAIKYGLTRGRIHQIVSCGPPRAVFVYRCFDKEQVLLYVGCTQDVEVRLHNHSMYSKWFKDSCFITFERHPSRDEGLRAEREAIKNEKPIFNVVHSDKKIVRSLSKHRVGKKNPYSEKRLSDSRNMVFEMLDIGMSVADIALESSLSNITIKKIINGSGSFPSRTTVSAIASLYTKAKRRKRAA